MHTGLAWNTSVSLVVLIEFGNIINYSHFISINNWFNAELIRWKLPNTICNTGWQRPVEQYHEPYISLDDWCDEGGGG